MKLVLDAGALVALERNDRAMWRRLKTAYLASSVAVCHGGIVGQVWRGRGPRRARLAAALAGIEVRPLDDGLGRAAGELLGVARRRDVIDAALVLLAADGDHIVTARSGRPRSPRARVGTPCRADSRLTATPIASARRRR